MPDVNRTWRREVETRLAELDMHPARRAQIVEELAAHLEDYQRSLIARGMTESDASAAVLQELSDEHVLRRELRRIEARGDRPAAVPAAGGRRNLLDALWHDVRYALRTLGRAPGFTAVAAVTLALGVGATTAIFAVLNAVVLRPLPYPNSDRLVRVWESNPAKGWPTFSASHPNFLDWRAQARSFEHLGAAANTTLTLADSAGAEIVRASAVSIDILPVLGVSPILGRTFRPEEDRPGGNTRVVLLAHGFWQRRFGADPSIVGRSVMLDSRPYEVVGVLPASFAIAGIRLDVLVPLAADPARSRGDHRLAVIGRLRPGVSIEEAQRELQVMAAQLGQQYPATNAGWTVVMRTFYDWLIPEETRQSLSIMMGAVGLVLLIACGNAASLLLARASVRQREFAVRAALGADRSRIVRQWLIESLLLALLAATLGVGIAWVTTRLVVSGAPAGLPRLDEVSVGPAVVAFAIGISLAAGVLFGLAPAIQASRQLNAGLRETTRSATGSRARQRFRASLVVAEVALSVALLIGAGLLMRSFWQVQQVDPGFSIDRTVTMRLSLPRAIYDTAEKSRQFYQRLLPTVAAMPGVEAVATSSGVPLTSGNTSTELTIPGKALPAGVQASAGWRNVSPGYFATLGIPLRGRDFEPEDSPTDGRTARPVVIISEEMARRYWPGEDVLGKTVLVHSFSQTPQTIIGVAGNVRSFGLDADVPPMVYGSALTYSGWNPMSLVVRSGGDPGSHVAAIRAAVRAIDPGVPVYDVELLDNLLANSLGARRFSTFLLACFAAIALVLASIGLFGVLAFLVSQRTRDIGIRMALGASRRDVFRLILTEGLGMASAGCVIGVFGGLAAGYLLQGILFSVGMADPATFVAVPALLFLVALLACYAPARRATRVDPLVALRTE